MSTRSLIPAAPVAAKARTVTRVSGALLQRKCACGGSTEMEGDCEECKKKKLQRKAAGNGPAIAPPIVHEVLRSPGQPLDTATRSFFEPRFGHDFSKVRVHADSRAGESAHAVQAQAYTVGHNLVFGDGRFAPETKSGQRLLAHELTHVVQQSQSATSGVQRKLEVGLADDALEHEAERFAEEIADASPVNSSPPASPPSTGGKQRLQRVVDTSATETSASAAKTVPPNTGLIVEDEVTAVGPGQMRKTEFLDRLHDSVCATADSELKNVGRTAQGCPFIERWIAKLRARDSQYIERAIRKYAHQASASTARDYFAAIGEQVRQGVRRWASTGDTSGVPPELMNEMGGGGILGAIGGAISGAFGAIGNAVAGIGKLFTKAGPGGAREANPTNVQAQLGSGRALEGGVKSRMETAFGHSFSTVRIHADSGAAELAAGLNARAFAIGNNVAFAAGEYRPGTMIGDALIAHELAHVMQQREGVPSEPMNKGGAEYNSLEADADASAVSAMVSLWTGAKTTVKNISSNAMPRLRSGLKLQSCGHKPNDPVPSAEPEIACTAQAIGGSTAACMARSNEQDYGLDVGIHYASNYKSELAEAHQSGRWTDDYRQGYADPDYFDRIGWMDWRLKEERSASAAIKKWLKGLTIAECNSTVVACEYDSVRAAIGDAKFDETFGSAAKETPEPRRIRIKSGTNDTPLAGYMAPTESATTGDVGTFDNRPAKVGEWYYFSNHPMYLLKHPGNDWQGENAVYGGRDASGHQVWTGLGADKKTEQDLIDEMIEYYGYAPYGYDLTKLEQIKNANGGTLPPQYMPGFYPPTVTKEKILNDPPYTLDDPFTHKKTTRKGGFVGSVGKKLDEDRLKRLKGE